MSDGPFTTMFSHAARELVRGLQWDGSRTSYAGRRLEWRHHGLGMLQAELSDTIRLHVWHPSLVSPGMAWPRCVHDHRFDLTSVVVVGEVIDVPCEVTVRILDAPGTGSVWPRHERAKMYEIQHAKEQDRMVGKDGCSTATSAKFLDDVWLSRGRPHDHPRVIPTGHEYKIRQREFHTTTVEELAVTVIHRSNFDVRLARVLCAPDADVNAISGIVRNESLGHRILVDSVLREAACAIATSLDHE